MDKNLNTQQKFTKYTDQELDEKITLWDTEHSDIFSPAYSKSALELIMYLKNLDKK